jgi:ribosomal protein S14
MLADDHVQSPRAFSLPPIVVRPRGERDRSPKAEEQSSPTTTETSSPNPSKRKGFLNRLSQYGSRLSLYIKGDSTIDLEESSPRSPNVSPLPQHPDFEQLSPGLVHSHRDRAIREINNCNICGRNLIDGHYFGIINGYPLSLCRVCVPNMTCFRRIKRVPNVTIPPLSESSSLTSKIRTPPSSKSNSISGFNNRYRSLTRTSSPRSIDEEPELYD